MTSARQRGFNLMEAMVSTALLALLLLVVGEVIHWALRSHRSGEAHRQAMAIAREVLNRISQEMATCISLGVLPNGGQLHSGVVYPDYAQDLNKPFSGQVFRREHINKDLPGGGTIPLDRAFNRLIFTSPGKRSANFSDSLTEFVFVEFVVPPRQDDPNQPQNRLYRRTYRVQDNALSTVIPGLSLNGSFEIANGNFFALDAADPLGNVNMLEHSLIADQRKERCLVAELPQDTDRLEFSVEHTQAPQERTTPLATDPYYHPALFTIQLAVRLNNQGNDKFLASQVLSQQVTIKSGF